MVSFDSKLAMVWLGAFKMLKNAEYTGSIFVIIIKLMVLSANGLSQQYHIHLVKDQILEHVCRYIMMVIVGTHNSKLHIKYYTKK